MAKIKLCGLKRLEDIKAANQCMPDFVGFVFAGSKRKVTKEQAATLKHHLSSEIKTVGVFVNAPTSEIIALADEKIIDIIQLHGDESESEMRMLKEATGLPIIKAIRVRSAAQIQQSQSLPCDYLLLDTYVKDAYGGSGKQFDWNLIGHLEKPYFLAGGITLANITQALQTDAYCLDLSSAIETDGVKDPLKMAAIVAAVRNGSAV